MDPPPAPELERAVPNFLISTPRDIGPGQADKQSVETHKVSKKLKDKNAKIALITAKPSEVDAAAAMEEDQSAPTAAPTAAPEARSRNTAAAVLSERRSRHSDEQIRRARGSVGKRGIG